MLVEAFNKSQQGRNSTNWGYIKIQRFDKNKRCMYFSTSTVSVCMQKLIIVFEASQTK
jgi:hypothetical protein